MRSETRQGRTRGGLQSSKRDKFRSKLEELKAKREVRGLKGRTLIDSDEDSDQSDVNARSQVLEEADAEFANEVLCRASDRERGSDEYESDFIEDDEDGEIGIDLSKAGIPLHLTGHASRKPFDYFKIEIDWMIHNKLDPAFERNDDLYELAHQKLNDEVMGWAQSTYTSAAWTVKFNVALKSRPDFSKADLGVEQSMLFSEGKCEACNRSGHPPKYRVMFSGSKYNKSTLERDGPRKQKSSNDGSNGEEDSDEEEEGDEDEHFLVGRFCFARAEIGHALHHWRFQLNDSILQWLRDNGHLDPARIVERENWTRKKRQKYANKILDGMNESGEMKSLYHMFKNSLNAARAENVSRYVLLHVQICSLIIARSRSTADVDLSLRAPFSRQELFITTMNASVMLEQGNI